MVGELKVSEKQDAAGAPETFSFEAESQQILELMTHSVYTNKEVFLRELISNASDALDKVRFQGLTNKDLDVHEDELHILVERDADNRTLTVSDNGVGMSRDELISDIGTIARSGSKDFLELLSKSRNSIESNPELIGQFGIGFYSTFMVADRVELVTRRAGEDSAVCWRSSGDGTYVIEPAERDAHGTSVILHLKSVDDEDGLEDFTAEWVIKRIVKKYSDFVAYPIRMEVKKLATDGEKDQASTAATELETLNSMKAIWTRPKDDVSEEEYNEFYKHVSHDWNEPLETISLKAEGTFEYRALLFLPANAPVDMFWRDAKRGLRLYVKRVLIMDDCEDLLPTHLRFVKGVVDAEDLSLNVSREILQQDRQIQLIRKRLVRKVQDSLSTMLENDRDKYNGFWKELGQALKEGLINPSENRDDILKLLLCESTRDGESLTTLEEYVERMPDGQDAIYYMTGASRDAAEKSPHLEAFRAKGYEVLLLTDPVDEIWLQTPAIFSEKPLQSVGKGAAALGTEDERKAAEEALEEKQKGFEPLLERIREVLDEHIKEVRLSTRLTESPACLVGETNDLTPQLEQMMKAMNQDVEAVKRILELNPDHEILTRMQAAHETNAEDDSLSEYAHLLYGQAVLAEGGPLPDPAGFSIRVAKLMARAM